MAAEVERKDITELFRNKPKEVVSVKVIDFDMSVWSMTVFMVKWAIAAIPALILLCIIGSLLSGTIISLMLALK